MKVTLREVAQEVGLSITTVSRALNGYDDVAEETKQTIKATAEALGYTPNLNARRLKTKRADSIGLILPTENLRFSDPFFSELLSGIVEQSAKYALELNVTTPHPPEQVANIYMRYIRSHRVDAFILFRIERDDPRIHQLQELGFPFVAFGRTSGINNFPYVDEDSSKGIQLAVEHLISLGHTRIACITEPTTLTKSFNRLQGYLNGLEANNIPIDPELIIEGQFRQRSGRQCGRQLLDLPHPPTAIVAVNDLLALGAMNAVQERGLIVGKEISVTGFDDITLAEYVNPPLTTVHQPAHQIGMLLCQMAVKAIKGEPLEKLQTILPPTLIKRQSTGACPK